MRTRPFFAKTNTSCNPTLFSTNCRFLPHSCAPQQYPLFLLGTLPPRRSSQPSRLACLLPSNFFRVPEPFASLLSFHPPPSHLPTTRISQFPPAVTTWQLAVLNPTSRSDFGLPSGPFPHFSLVPTPVSVLESFSFPRFLDLPTRSPSKDPLLFSLSVLGYFFIARSLADALDFRTCRFDSPNTPGPVQALLHVSPDDRFWPAIQGASVPAQGHRLWGVTG